MARVFLLSPASTTGKRAAILTRPEADFPLARALRTQEGAPLGEVFSFLSGLYFRGKLAYARRFAAAEDIRVIAPGTGLVTPDLRVNLAALLALGEVRVDPGDPRYRIPLQRDARALLAKEVVLLGSVATPRYVEPLLEVLGDALRVPADFAGRGDMSRGGLLLRCLDEGRELAYVRAGEALRHGPRPPRLAPRQR